MFRIRIDREERSRLEDQAYSPLWLDKAHRLPDEIMIGAASRSCRLIIDIVICSFHCGSIGSGYLDGFRSCRRAFCGARPRNERPRRISDDCIEIAKARSQLCSGCLEEVNLVEVAADQMMELQVLASFHWLPIQLECSKHQTERGNA